MSTKQDWQTQSKADILRQKNNNYRPPPNDRNPLNSIPVPRLAFDDDNDANKSENKPQTKRKRYVARIKNVCMAIPFDPTQTLFTFQKKVLLRAASHRKLKNESKLANRIQYIKLATPHFPQLIDCYGQDALCEIATEADILIFHTLSDDEKDDELYTLKPPNNIDSIYVPKANKKSTNTKKKDSKRKTNNNNSRPQTAKYANTPKATPSNKALAHRKFKAEDGETKKTKRRSMIVKSSKPNVSTPIESKSKNTAYNVYGNTKKEKKTNNFSGKKNRRNLSADLDQNSTKSIVDKTRKKRVDSSQSSRGNVLKPMMQIKSRSGGDLHGRSVSDSKQESDGNDGNESDDSVRSGYSGHSGYGSDENRENLEVIAPKSGKKKKKNRSHDVQEFAKQVMNAQRTGKKRDFEDEERVGRKNRSDSSHGRSISLSGANLLHSGDTKKKKTKKSKKGSESIYASNVQSKSSKASRRQNAFEFFTGKSKGGGKLSVDQEKRKRKYRYGNRNINVIRRSVVPYDEEQDQLPEYYLDLKYIHGYDGYDVYSRQNLFLSHDEQELIYPMARTGIMLNLSNNKQRHWMDGREAISSICVHPTAPIIVTGHVQKGPDRAKIRVWNYKTLVLHKLIKKVHDAAVLCCQWSKNSGYLYTIGAQEMHKCVLWNASDLFKLDTKHGKRWEDGIDHEDILNADVTSKKKNFINCPIDIVSDILMGKQDILGFEINPYISDSDEKDGLLDEFVCFGKKNVKYYEVKLRNERRNGRNVELILPIAKTIVMSKLGGKSTEYERVYQSCVWLKSAPSWYLLGGHSGTVYICYKQQCLKKLNNFGLTSQVGAMINIESAPNVVFLACWDGKLCQFNVSNVTNLKIKKVKERMIYVPRSGDEETGLKTQSPRTMIYDQKRNVLYLGLRTNQIIELNMSILFKQQSNEQLHATRLLLDSHYGYVKCLACHPYEPFYVTGSEDSTLRIWDINGFECLSRFKFDEREKPSFLRFSHSGYLLAVGLTTSKIVILAWRDCNLSEVKAVVVMPFKIDKSLKRSQQMDAKNSDFTTDITVIKWSSDDLNFAAGHIDAIAHIFSIKYHNDDPTDESAVFDYNLDIIPWDASLDVSNGLIDIQWSDDNQWLLTFTKDQDLMVWFLNRNKFIFEHYLYWLDPDKIYFSADPLLAGWDVEGVFQSYVGWDGTDLNALSLTKKQFKKSSPVLDYDLNRVTKQKQQYKCRLLASADNKGYIRIHNYPALKESAHHYYSGHSNQVCSVQWSANDQYLISVGGSDRSVFQWHLTDIPNDYIQKYKPLKSTNQFKK